MDYTTFDRLELSLKQIRNSLAQNSKLRELLISKEPGGQIPPIKQALEHLFLFDLVSVETTPPFDKKTFACISFIEDKMSGSIQNAYLIRIGIFADRSVWMFGEQIRLIQAIKEVIATLNNKKVATAGELKYEGAIQALVNEQVLGYYLLFNTVDGLGVQDDNK